MCTFRVDYTISEKKRSEIDYAGLSKSVLNYMDVLKILKIFGEIRDIKKEIAIFYLKMCMKGRKSIADKILSKMGRKNIGDWLKL